MFCTNCGAALPENSNFCTSCGSNINTNNLHIQKEESSTLAICSIIFAILIFPVGYICGVIGYYTYQDPKNRKKCLIGIILSIVLPIIVLISQ